MRFFAMCQRNNSLTVHEINNLFCAGKKAGLLVGHTEAIVTGVLAGFNAAQYVMKKPLLILPRNTAIGEAIAYVNEEMITPNGIKKKYTFSGSVLFEHLKERKLYEIDPTAIQAKVQECHLDHIFA